jgi:hypothetical protein
MAQKELTIKINIQGTEVVLKGAKQIELFTKNIQNMKDELTKLGERTAENAEQFDKLVGDINSLEQAFAGAAEEAKKTNEEIKGTGDESEKAGEKTQSYAAQIRKLRVELAGLGERTAANADEYDRLTTQIVDLSEKQEDLQFGTKKLDDSLAQLPGPIGKAAQGFKVFDDGLKNARSAMANLTRTFPILKNAIAATGIGALVILFGLLVAAVMKAFQSFKPLQDAVGKLGIVFDLVMKLVEPLIELIGKGLTIALEGLAKAVAFVTGNMEEYNKAVANKAATEALAANVKKQEEFLDANAYKYDEYTQRKIKANIEYNKKVLELNADETRSEASKQALLKQYRDKADNEINQADKDRQKKADDAKKSANDKAKQAAQQAADIEKDYQKRLKTIRDENTLLLIKDEADKGRAQLKIQYDNQIAEINQLKVTEDKKKALRAETLKNYELLLKQFNENIIKEEKKASEDLAKQTRDITTSLIKDEKLRLAEEAKNRRDDALKAVDETKANEKEKAVAKETIRKQYDADIAKIDEEIAKKDKENVYKQIEFERESRKLGLQNKLTEIDLGTQAEVQKIKDRSKIFAEQTEIDRLAEIDNLNKLLATKEISQKDYEARVVEINKQASLAIQTNTVQTERAILEQRQANRDAVNMLAGSIGNLAQAMGEETAAGQALIKMQQALTLATTISAIADQLKGLGQAAKLPFPGNIVAIATFIGTIGTALVQFKTLFGMGPKDLSGKGGGASGGGAASVAGLGRNYADGGLIGGRRHAQGGTLIEAEAGEAIMTRGAVTMFAPMLSAMNQMGGGTAFNRSATMSSYDAPVLDKPAQAQEPVIMKTYVVSNELTTEAEKQARLKDLSTL